MFLYADDTVLFYAEKKFTEIENILSNELKQMARWLNEYNLDMPCICFALQSY